MIKHIVLFAFVESVCEKDIEEVTKRFLALEDKIDIVVKIEAGIDISVEKLNDGFTHGFVVTFDSVPDRDTYLPHPIHKEFSEFAGAFLKKVLVFDFEV